MSNGGEPGVSSAESYSEKRINKGFEDDLLAVSKLQWSAVFANGVRRSAPLWLAFNPKAAGTAALQNQKSSINSSA